MESTYDEEALTNAYHRLFKAFPILRSTIVGNETQAAFYLSDALPILSYSQRKNIVDLLDFHPTLNTSALVRLKVVTDLENTIISFTFHHAIADGVAILGYIYYLIQFLTDPDKELSDHSFPHGLEKVIDEVKPGSTDLSVVMEYLPTVPCHRLGCPLIGTIIIQAILRLLSL